MTKEELLQRILDIKSHLSYATLGEENPENRAQAFYNLGLQTGAIDREISELQAKLANDDNYQNTDIATKEIRKNELTNTVNELDIRIKENEAARNNIQTNIESINSERERVNALATRANDDLQRLEEAKKVCAAMGLKGFYNHDADIIPIREKLEGYQRQLQNYDAKVDQLNKDLSELEVRNTELESGRATLNAEIESIDTTKVISIEKKDADNRRLAYLLTTRAAMDAKKAVSNANVEGKLTTLYSLVEADGLSNEEIGQRLQQISSLIPQEVIESDSLQRTEELNNNNEALANIEAEIVRLEDKTSNRDNYKYSVLDLDEEAYNITHSQQQLNRINRELAQTEIDIDILNTLFSDVGKDLAASQNRHAEEIQRQIKFQNLSLSIDNPIVSKVIETNLTLSNFQAKIINELTERLGQINQERSAKELTISTLRTTAENLEKSIALQQQIYDKKMNGINEDEYRSDMDSLAKLKERGQLLKTRNEFLSCDIQQELAQTVALIPSLDTTVEKKVVKKVKVVRLNARPVVKENTEEQLVPTEQTVADQPTQDGATEELIPVVEPAVEDTAEEQTIETPVETTTHSESECTALAKRLDENALAAIKGFESASDKLKESAKKPSFIKKLKEWVKKYKVQITTAAITIAMILSLKACGNTNTIRPEEPTLPQTAVEDIYTDGEEPHEDIIEEDDTIVPVAPVVTEAPKEVVTPDTTESAPVIEEVPVVEETPVIEEIPVVEEEPEEVIDEEPEEVIPSDPTPVTPDPTPVTPDPTPVTPDPTPVTPAEDNTINVHLEEGDYFVGDGFTINNGGAENGNLAEQATQDAINSGNNVVDYTQSTSDSLQSVTNNDDGSMDIEIKDDNTNNITSTDSTSSYMDSMTSILEDNLYDAFGDDIIIDSSHTK